VLSYPHETLHEIITNALLHRDYSIADDVHVRIFDNRVEVENPGTLAGHVTEANIYEERFARNGSVVRIINKFPNPPNKDIGEGLRTARDTMEHMRLKAPSLKQRANSVIVFIRHESIASHDTLVMDYVDKNGTVTSAQVRSICHIERHKAWEVIKRLQSRNKLEQVPETRGANTIYRKATGGAPLITRRESDRRLARERLTKVQEYLQQHDAITSPILIKEYGLPPVTAYRLIKGLEKKGMIKRQPGPRHGTAVYRKATNSGS